MASMSTFTFAFLIFTNALVPTRTARLPVARGSLEPHKAEAAAARAAASEPTPARQHATDATAAMVAPSGEVEALLVHADGDGHLQVEARTEVDCGLMVVTTFFTTKIDWQRDQYAQPQFVVMQEFYESASDNGINVTVLYDDLPDHILRYETDSFKFLKINFDGYDAEEGLNDVRFNMVRDVVDHNPSWRSIFLTDLFDVKIGRNPCGDMMDGKLYVGRETGSLYHNKWMEKRFDQMGGKYMEWFREAKTPWYILNAGIVGGRREVFIRFLQEMSDVLNDPDLTARKHHEQENVNMAAFNYVVRVSMGLEEDADEGQPGWVSGPPVHSEYKLYQDDRTDVWFIHK